MGLFDKLVSKVIGGAAAVTAAPAPALQSSVGELIVTFTGPTGPAVEVTDAEVAERVREHAFVLATDPPVLKTVDEWWNEDTNNRRRREGSEKAYAWLLPFIPLDVAKLPSLQAAQEWGPHGAGAIAKEIRALIRDRRKSKEPYQDLLRALYGACVAADLSASLEFEGTQPHNMARFVDISKRPANTC